MNVRVVGQHNIFIFVIVMYFVACVILSLLIYDLILYVTTVKCVVLIAVNVLHKSLLLLLNTY